MAETDPVAQIERIPDRFDTLVKEVHKVIIGQDDIVRHLVCAMLARGHVLLIGVPGLAKTLLVKTLAQSLSWDFKRIQFTPDLMPSDIIGTEIIDTDQASGGRSLRFVRGPIFANVVLADEINRTPPKTQSALLEAMQEYAVTAAGVTMPMELPFFVVATQNPIEQEGTYPLPEAQLDRFMYCLHVGYPGASDEEAIATTTTTNQNLVVNPVFTKEDLIEMQRLVREIPVSPHVVKYAVSLARASRPESPEASPMVQRYAQWGAGPRAAQYLVLGAKALSITQGKSVPTCNDVRALAPLVLRHRIIPNYAAVADNIGSHDLVNDIIRTVREPAYAHGA
jgi:MoxR-like ATPase